MRDTPDHLAALVGMMHIGAIALPLDWRSPTPEIRQLIARFSPKAVLSDNRGKLGSPPASMDAGQVTTAEPDRNAPARLADSPLVYSLTSGTTGKPKALVLTHEEMLGRAMTLAAEHVILAEDRFLSMLPLAYSNGRVIAFSLFLLGASALTFPNLFETDDLVRFIAERRVTALMASANVLRKLIAAASPTAMLIPGLRMLVTGGSKMTPQERAAVADRVAPRLIDYYGSTGGGPTSLIENPQDGAAPTSVGRPMVGMEIEIVGEHGARLARGEVGKLRLRGPGVVKRQVGDDLLDGEGIADGWYYPGDLGSLDDHGLVHLHGRAADLIKRGGLMVYAQEVEQALLRHQSVAEAAVIGVPSPTLGQEVVAFLVTRSAIDESEVLHHCRRELAPYKVPAQVRFVKTLPRNASDKVVKSQLAGWL